MKYTFTFKEINTQQTIHISTDSSLTLYEFIEDVSILMYNEYGNICFHKSFDIVEAGHYNNSNGIAPELADKIDVMYDQNDTLEKIYGTRWKNTSFYIRIIH
jgi:hypothetical protein